MTINNNQYGKIIERLRSEHSLSQDTLANILLINTDTLQAVEKGTAQLSDSQLNMCANIFDVSKFALENGEIRPRVKRAELQFNLDKLLEQYNEAVKSQSYMLEAIQQAAPPERYEAKYSELQEFYIQGYFVYDTLTEDFVRDKDNFPVKYDTAKEALDAARRMDEFYKNATLDKSLSADNENKDVNVTDSVTQQEIERQNIENNISEDYAETAFRM